ncbi:MAG: hypothetical protein ABJE66_25255 [Deltaproteobacteria bacterium]
MTTGLPARVAICAVMLTAQLAGPVRADVPPHVPPPRTVVAPAAPVAPTPERRQVAVIDLSEDDQVRALSERLYETINLSDTMMVPNKHFFDAYLIGSLYDEDAQGIVNAKSARTSAMTYLDEADSVRAEATAKSGQASLANVKPTTEVQMLYADLSFLAGLAALDQGRAQDANLALALTHRMDPGRQLSDAQWPPNTIAAYKRAIESKPQLVKIDVALDSTGQTPNAHSDSRVWIDFVDRGPLGSFDGIEVGDHVITIVGPTILTDGAPKRIDGPTTVRLKPADATPETQVSRARLALAHAQAQHDDAARASAIKQLATLLGVGDAVMISKRPDGTLQWETWRDRAPGFTAPQAYTDQKPDDILEGLGPLHRPPPPRFVGPPLGRLPITVDTPWYQERWIQASVGAGVVAAIVGSILIATHTRDIQFGLGDIKDVASTSTAR